MIYDTRKFAEKLVIKVGDISYDVSPLSISPSASITFTIQLLQFFVGHYLDLLEKDFLSNDQLATWQNFSAKLSHL